MLGIRFILLLCTIFIDYREAHGALITKTNIITTFTPFNKQGDLNLTLIPEYAEYVKNNNITTVVVSGKFGEGPLLTLSEKKRLVQAWVNAAKPRGLQIIVQVGLMPLRSTRELASYCEKLKVDGLITYPIIFFNDDTVQRAIKVLQMISSAAPTLPLFYNDDPMRTRITVNPSKIFCEASSKIPMFAGMKTEMGTALQIRADCEIKNNQSLIISGYTAVEAAYDLDFNSSVTVSTNVFPTYSNAIKQAVESKQNQEAAKFQTMINNRITALTSSGRYISQMKAAFKIVTGINVGQPRQPLHGTTNEDEKQITKILKQFGEPMKSPVE